MSWMARLYETYEQVMELELPADEKPIPISHTVQNAHINVVIDGEGNFKRASVLQKTQITLPATESSAGRSSGEAPHPLADKIQYVAADYSDYGGKKAAYFGSYRQQLSDWCESEHHHLSVCAILAYVSKQSLVADLIAQQVLWVDDENVLLTAWCREGEEPPTLLKILPKEKGQFEQGSALICWSVERPGHAESDTWTDKGVQQSWINFDATNAGHTDLCYVSGRREPIARSHPAKLRHSGDRAKLVSSNDLSGFTFKGRFTDSKKSIAESGLQGAAIGSLTTQKTHNALRWLIKRQGFRNGDQAIVAWAAFAKPIPAPIAATLDFDFDDFSEVEDIVPVQEDTSDASTDHTLDVGQSFATKLNRYMAGYRAKLAANDQISIMAIDSATPGRMAVTYYRETLPGEYLDQIFRWHTDMAWYQRVTKEISRPKGKPTSKVIWPVSAPSPFTIMNAVYGDILKSNDSLKKNFYERIMPCILEGSSIPRDLVSMAVNRARSPAGRERWEWEKTLGVACSLYRAFHFRHPTIHQRKEFSMSLDTDNTSRDYLYGRLLAMAERIEEVALRAASVNRPTAASRLMQRFSDRPYSTWPNIYKQLEPYMRQLRNSRAGFLVNANKELDAIMVLFDGGDFTNDGKLNGEFLLGFHCQRLALRNTKKSTDNIKDSDHESE